MGQSDKPTRGKADALPEPDSLPKLSAPWLVIAAFFAFSIAVTAVAYWNLYPGIEDPMPTHFDGAGRPDAWEPKTTKRFLTELGLGPAIMVILAAVFATLLAAIGNATMSTSTKSVGKKLLHYYGIRIAVRYLVALLLGLGILIEAAMIGNYALDFSLPAYVTLTPMILLFIVVFAVWGRKLGKVRAWLEPETAQYWRWGLVYNNPDDSRVLVDISGNGSNFTFNVGHKGVKIVAVGAAVILALVIIGLAVF